jgi:two-component system, LytTR family, response regulator
MNAVIVDDEPLYIELLSKRIAQIAPSINILATFNSPLEGIQYLREHPIDILFLDVEMPEIDGFVFLDMLRPVNFPVIFVTSHEGYALKAFRYAAVDYLLKPVKATELSEALNKMSRTRKEDLSRQLDVLRGAMSELRSENSRFNKLVLNTQEKALILDIDEIVNIEASGPYSQFYTSDGKSHMTSKPLGYYEDLLKANGFFRLHRSHLVNLTFIHSINKEEGVVLLRNGKQAPFSKDSLSKLMEYLK